MSRVKRSIVASASLECRVAVGLTINFIPRPSTEAAAQGIDLLEVRSWKFIRNIFEKYTAGGIFPSTMCAFWWMEREMSGRNPKSLWIFLSTVVINHASFLIACNRSQSIWHQSGHSSCLCQRRRSLFLETALCGRWESSILSRRLLHGFRGTGSFLPTVLGS